MIQTRVKIGFVIGILRFDHNFLQLLFPFRLGFLFYSFKILVSNLSLQIFLCSRNIHRRNPNVHIDGFILRIDKFKSFLGWRFTIFFTGVFKWMRKFNVKEYSLIGCPSFGTSFTSNFSIRNNFQVVFQ